MSLIPNQMIEILKLLYGTAERGDYWGRTFRKHLVDYLGIKSFMSEAVLFFKKIEDKLLDLCATYVDDTH